MIHADANEQNILIKRTQQDFEICGIIDFQDSHNGYHVCDLAILIMYILTYADTNQLTLGGYALAGYLSKQSLTDVETSLLYWLVCGRFLTSLLLGLYNYSKTNNPYMLETQERGWAVLNKLWATPSSQLISDWLDTKLCQLT